MTFSRNLMLWYVFSRPNHHYYRTYLYKLHQGGSKAIKNFCTQVQILYIFIPLQGLAISIKNPLLSREVLHEVRFNMLCALIGQLNSLRNKRHLPHSSVRAYIYEQPSFKHTCDMNELMNLYINRNGFSRAEK